MPTPKGPSIVPGSEWRDLPQTVGSNRHLPLHYLGERIENGLRLKVFYFEAAAEDKICAARVKKFWKDWIGTVPCHGEVWTDSELNIFRISEQMEMPPQSGVQSCSITILYGWLRHERLAATLVPASLHMISTMRDRGVLESSAMFSGYYQFHATTKIVATSAESAAE